MNEINTAQRLRIAAQEKGETEKIMRIKQAEAEAESNILHGKGIAGQRQAIIEGLGHSVEEVKRQYPDFSSESIMKMILVIQYLDTLKEMSAYSKTNTIFMSHAPSSIDDISQKIMEAIFASKDS